MKTEKRAHLNTKRRRQVRHLKAEWTARGRALSYQFKWNTGLYSSLQPRCIHAEPNKNLSFDLFLINPGDSSQPRGCELEAKRLFKATLSRLKMLRKLAKMPFLCKTASDVLLSLNVFRYCCQAFLNLHIIYSLLTVMFQIMSLEFKQREIKVALLLACKLFSRGDSIYGDKKLLNDLPLIPLGSEVAYVILESGGQRCDSPDVFTTVNISQSDMLTFEFYFLNKYFNPFFTHLLLVLEM